MPIRFACPACNCAINAPDSAGGKQARCPSCKAAVMVPVPQGRLLSDPTPIPMPQAVGQPEPAGFDFDEQPASAPRRATSYRKPPSGHGAAIAVLVLACLIGGGLLVWNVSTRGHPLGILKYPYPECSAIIGHLDKSVNDPTDMEIVEWVKREANTKAGTVDITVTFRAKNALGARVIQTWLFHLKGGKIVDAGEF